MKSPSSPLTSVDCRSSMEVDFKKTEMPSAWGVLEQKIIFLFGIGVLMYLS